MTLNLTVPVQAHTDFTPRITVIGVGGGGTNAVNNMIASNLTGVEFIVANTDAQQLVHSKADRRVQLGPHLTQGLGAGAKPEIGRAAAEEAADELMRHLEGVHMVFVTAGMGGGTGTGAAPVIARMARERGILTVGVVTKPFNFEGGRRARAAEQGIAELQQYVDTLIVIPNQNLFRISTERTGWKEAFKLADNVLYMGVRGVTDLMMSPGDINLDFADIRTVMAEMGKAMMGTGEAEGEGRAVRAAEDAINNPLLEDTSMAGARGLLINITGGDDMTLFEVDEAINRIRKEVADDANIIFGSASDDTLAGRVRVSVVATGIDMGARIEAVQTPLRLVAGAGGAQGFAPPTVFLAAPAALELTPSAPPASPLPVLTPRAEVVHPSTPPSDAPAMPVQAPALRTSYAPPRPAVPAQRSSAIFSDSGAAPAAPSVSAAPVPSAAPSPASSSAPSSSPSSAPSSATSSAPSSARSLFGMVTRGMRRTQGAEAAAAPVPQRAEPSFPAAESAAAPAAPAAPQTEDTWDIPAFLRRQSS